VETASETQSAWAAGTTVTQSEEGSTATETETSPSEDTATKTSLSAVHSDSNRESALANPSVQESGNNLYLLAENTLLQYPLDLDVSGKADETILYKAADGNSIISFSSDGSNVYFILEKENGSTSVMRIRSGEDAVDLKDFDDESFGEIQAYDDVVYLFGFRDGATHYAYPVKADGKLGTEQKDSKTVYAVMPSGGSEIDVSSTTDNSRYSLPYCLKTFGKAYLLDADGNLISADKDEKNFKVVAKDAAKFNEEGGMIAALTDKYLIRYETSTEDSRKEYWQKIDLQTGKKDVFYEGTSFEDILDFDKDGMIIGKTEGSGDTKTCTVQKISYEGGKAEVLFTFSPENSTSITDNTFARNSFTLTSFGIMYVRTKGYQDFWFLRPYDRMENETPIGNAVYDSGLSKAGISIKASEENVRPDGDPEGLIISVKKQIPSFNGSSDAEKKMNTTMENYISALCKSAVSSAKEDYKAIGTSAGDDMGFPYSYEVRVTGVTLSDENYVCIGTQVYDYTGGAHGGSTNTYYSFDRKTGELLRLSDIVSDSSKEVKALLLKHLEEKVSANPDMYFDEAVENVKKDNKGDYEFSLRKNGIGIEFGDYDIAPHASGLQTIIIPYGELKMKISI